MSQEETEKANSVTTLSDMSFSYFNSVDAYVLLIGFKDESQWLISSPAVVDMRIENEDGIVVYEKTNYVTLHDFGTITISVYGERYLASLYIFPNEIERASSPVGYVFLTATIGERDFGEKILAATRLPSTNLTMD